MISSFLSLFAAIPLMVVVHLPVVPTPDDSFASDINRTFEMLKKESPELYQHLNKMPREKLLQTVLSALETGVNLQSQVQPAVTRELKPTPGKRLKYYPARLINSNSIFYARIDNINPATLERLKSDVEISSRIANKPSGVIIDLRNADRGNYALCTKYLPFFQTQNKDKTHFQKIPMVILTGFRTSGAPELLAALLGKSKSAMILGTKGAGKMFPVKEITFDNKKWFVPQLDAQWNLSADANTPDVEFNPYPQIPYEQIGKKDLRATDDAIRRACDLLKTITVLK